MNLTNPPLTRGLGKTASPNRRGLLLKEPTTRGLAQTATRAARESETTGEPLKVTQMVTAYTAGNLSSDSAATVIQTLTIHRKAGSLLDLNAAFDTLSFDNTGGFYSADIVFRREGASIASFTGRVPCYFPTAGSELFAGRFFVGFVDDDYVSGETDYDVTVRFRNSGSVAVDGTVNERYLRVLERKF